MKLILIIIAIIVVIFILLFLAGMVFAAVLGRKKNRRAYAIVILSKLPEETRKKLIDILLAYKNSNVEEVNNIVATIGAIQLNQLLGLVGPQNRPKEFSAGKLGDNLSWAANENALQDQGYTINASKIIAGIILHYLDIVLIEIIKKDKNN
jgi:cbb3-type cytochrome oxidase subunit 3